MGRSQKEDLSTWANYSCSYLQPKAEAYKYNVNFAAEQDWFDPRRDNVNQVSILDKKNPMTSKIFLALSKVQNTLISENLKF
jgi:hypothetical protein